jgi:trehalose 6-phosphate phosphatase
MKNVFQDRSTMLVRGIATDALVCFDFDGTLAPHVGQLSAARVRPDTLALLACLAGRCRVAVLSGRSRADLVGRLGGLPLMELVGEHGIERYEAGRASRELVAWWAPTLTASLGRLPGVEVAKRRCSVAIRYGRAHHRGAVVRAIRAALADLGPSVRCIAGRHRLDVIPARAPHRGRVLDRLREESRAAAVVYVGDDTIDEDAFALSRADPETFWGIRVGHRARSYATHFVPSQGSIDALLGRLLAATGVPGAAH